MTNIYVEHWEKITLRICLSENNIQISLFKCEFWPLKCYFPTYQPTCWKRSGVRIRLTPSGGPLWSYSLFLHFPSVLAWPERATLIIMDSTKSQIVVTGLRTNMFLVSYHVPNNVNITFVSSRHKRNEFYIKIICDCINAITLQKKQLNRTNARY